MTSPGAQAQSLRSDGGDPTELHVPLTTDQALEAKIMLAALFFDLELPPDLTERVMRLR